jgi:FkbM family methyltransferase
MAPIIRRLPAGRYRAINRICRRPPAAFAMRMPAELGGQTFRCDLHDSIAREVCFTGRYEPQETALVRAILRPGMSFVDVGANWGYFTLLAAHLVGAAGQVVSLEPDPRLFAVLQQNVAGNGLRQVTVLPVAAAQAAGPVTLAGYEETGGNFGLSRMVSRPTGTARLYQVPARRLDVVLDECGLGTVHLLKMDIEGAEGFALAGLEAALAGSRVQRLLLELHPAQLAEHGQSAAAVIAQLRRRGYRGWKIDHSPSFSRRIAYRRRLDCGQILRPLEEVANLDPWPHLLWTLPGLEATW